MNLYFMGSDSRKRPIKENLETREELFACIDTFLTERSFTSHYVRMWYGDGYTWIDVGSHTEFFLCDENLMGDYGEETKETTKVDNRHE